MSELTRDEVLAAVHPIDDATVAEIIATGINHDELVQACHFYAKDRTARTPEAVPRGHERQTAASGGTLRPGEPCPAAGK